MRKRGIMKLSLISNERSRKTTFMKRKPGVMKKLHELTTLCGVQACAVIYSPYQSGPEAWPSREGAEEVASKFIEMPMTASTKKIMDQETYLQERIAKGREKVEKLTLENRELQARQFMFNCLEGKMFEYRYSARDLLDLKQYIDQYIDQLTRRIKILAENSESSSLPPLPTVVVNAYPLPTADFSVVSDAAMLTTPSGFYDDTQYHNMNMNQNLHEHVQYKAPTDLYDPHGMYSMNLNQDMNLHLNLKMDMTSNQQQSFMDPMMEQHMGYTGGQSSISFMDGNHQQLPIDDLANTNHMPSTTTTTSTADVYAPYINNNL